MMMKKIASLMIILSFVFVLAACGSGSSSGQAKSDGNGSSTDKKSSDSDVRTVEVASAAESKPLSWKASGNVLKGYEPDVLRAIDKKLKDYKFHLQAVSDEGEETGLATGKYDIAAGGFYKTDERAKQFLIPSQNDSLSLMKLYVRKDSDIKGMKDLVGKKITPPTTGGGVYNFIVNWEKENPKYKLKYKTSSAGIPYPQRLKEVVEGRYDALILPSNLGEDAVIKNQNLPIRATDPVQIDKTYLIIHKSDENKKLSEAVNQALKELKDDGTLAKLSKKYFGENIFKYE